MNVVWRPNLVQLEIFPTLLFLTDSYYPWILGYNLDNKSILCPVVKRFLILYQISSFHSSKNESMNAFLPKEFVLEMEWWIGYRSLVFIFIHLASQLPGIRIRGSCQRQEFQELRTSPKTSLVSRIYFGNSLR